MMDHAARIEALEAENDRLLERIAALEACIGADISPHLVLGLTGKEAALLGVLCRREQATKDQLLTALYGHLPEDDEPEIKIIDVFVCKLRRKLKHWGVEITTIWGVGYALNSENKAKLAALVTTKAA